MEVDNDINAEEGAAQTPSSGRAGAKLKQALHYAALAIVPVIATAALVVALAAFIRHPDQAQASEYAARLSSLSAELAETQAELETLRIALARERSVHEEERKEAEARDAKIVQVISSLQTKMKISPTLQEQLQMPATAGALPIPASAAASAPVAATAAALEPKVHAKQPGTAAPPRSATVQKRVTPPLAPKKPDKRSPQVKALKEAIEQLNKKK